MNEPEAGHASQVASPPMAAARLARLGEIAAELGADDLASDAHAEQRRLEEARFFVACVGQFKRGKSTLINALVGQSVLPVGAVPVTSVMTILRHASKQGPARTSPGSCPRGRCLRGPASPEVDQEAHQGPPTSHPQITEPGCSPRAATRRITLTSSTTPTGVTEQAAITPQSETAGRFGAPAAAVAGRLRPPGGSGTAPPPTRATCW